MEEEEGGKEKASLELLQHNYNDLNTRKIKDSLSSFLPDIPGTYIISSHVYTLFVLQGVAGFVLLGRYSPL